MSPSDKRKLLKTVDSVEDQIYRIFRKARIITNASSNSLFAIPAKERFVYVDWRNETKAVTNMSSCWDGLAELMSNCDGGFLDNKSSAGAQSYVEVAEDDDDDDLDQDESSSQDADDDCSEQQQKWRNSRSSKSGGMNSSFRDFVFNHVQVGFAQGFDDNVGRHTQPSFFVLPQAGVWVRVANVLHSYFMNHESVGEVILGATSTDMQFSEARCEKVLPLALATYQESLPPHYNETLHLSRVSNRVFSVNP
jgi:protein SMG8